MEAWGQCPEGCLATVPLQVLILAVQHDQHVTHLNKPMSLAGLGWNASTARDVRDVGPSDNKQIGPDVPHNVRHPVVMKRADGHDRIAAQGRQRTAGWGPGVERSNARSLAGLTLLGEHHTCRLVRRAVFLPDPAVFPGDLGSVEVDLLAASASHYGYSQRSAVRPALIRFMPRRAAIGVRVPWDSRSLCTMRAMATSKR